MSKLKTTQPAVKLEPRVMLCEANPHSLMIEVERLLLAGYRLELGADLTMVPGCYIVSLALPEA